MSFELGEDCRRALGALSKLSPGLVRELCGQAIDVALGSGAGYADARAVARRVQHVGTKNG
jgi:hypothetical protein